MAGSDSDAGKHLTGLSKYFNSETNFGRANVTKATYGVVALIGIYLWLKPSKKPSS